MLSISKLRILLFSVHAYGMVPDGRMCMQPMVMLFIIYSQLFNFVYNQKEETEAAEKDRTEQQANRYDEILEETRRAMESAKKQREQEQAEIFQEMKSAQERFQQDFEKHEKERRKDEQEAAEERARQSQQFGFWSLVVAVASLLLKLFSGGGD